MMLTKRRLARDRGHEGYDMALYGIGEVEVKSAAPTAAVAIYQALTTHARTGAKQEDVVRCGRSIGHGSVHHLLGPRLHSWCD